MSALRQCCHHWCLNFLHRQQQSHQREAKEVGEQGRKGCWGHLANVSNSQYGIESSHSESYHCLGVRLGVNHLARGLRQLPRQHKRRPVSGQQSNPGGQPHKRLPKGKMQSLKLKGQAGRPQDESCQPAIASQSLAWTRAPTQRGLYVSLTGFSFALSPRCKKPQRLANLRLAAVSCCVSAGHCPAAQLQIRLRCLASRRPHKELMPLASCKSEPTAHSRMAMPPEKTETSFAEVQP
mmetsp:Transcript_140153/g.349279  ORF Transcript_140153/g.349279 Transcript_140153/m.349279 type:complete len:237 (+) Transcript_140153:1268-1978(+)